MSEEKNKLAGALVGLGATITDAMDKTEGFVPCGHPAEVVNSALEALDSELPSDAIAQKTDEVTNFIDHVADHRGVDAYAAADVSDLSDLRAQLADEIKNVSAKLAATGEHIPEVSNWIYRSLAALDDASDSAARVMLAKLDAIKSILK